MPPGLQLLFLSGDWTRIKKVPVASTSPQQTYRMPEYVSQYFLELYKSDPKWNFIFFYDSVQAERILEGFWLTIELAVICVVLSVVIGVVGAWMQKQPNRIFSFLAILWKHFDQFSVSIISVH